MSLDAVIGHPSILVIVCNVYHLDIFTHSRDTVIPTLISRDFFNELLSTIIGANKPIIFCIEGIKRRGIRGIKRRGIRFLSVSKGWMTFPKLYQSPTYIATLIYK
jgi:hypothetical protein